MNSETLKEKIEQLSPDEQEQVLKFIDTILNNKQYLSGTHKFTFNWAGGLVHLKDQYTSVELQKKINEWWVEGI